jgi:hypothetical protein
VYCVATCATDFLFYSPRLLNLVTFLDCNDGDHLQCQDFICYKLGFIRGRDVNRNAVVFRLQITPFAPVWTSSSNTRADESLQHTTHEDLMIVNMVSNICDSTYKTSSTSFPSGSTHKAWTSASTSSVPAWMCSTAT